MGTFLLIGVAVLGYKYWSKLHLAQHNWIFDLAFFSLKVWVKFTLKVAPKVASHKIKNLTFSGFQM